MPDWVVAASVIYFLVAMITLFVTLAGIDREDPFVVRYGMYRGVTLAVIASIFCSVFWFPIITFYWIRGLIRGD